MLRPAATINAQRVVEQILCNLWPESSTCEEFLLNLYQNFRINAISFAFAVLQTEQQWFQVQKPSRWSRGRVQSVSTEYLVSIYYSSQFSWHPKLQKSAPLDSFVFDLIAKIIAVQKRRAKSIDMFCRILRNCKYSQNHIWVIEVQCAEGGLDVYRFWVYDKLLFLA